MTRAFCTQSALFCLCVIAISARAQISWHDAGLTPGGDITVVAHDPEGIVYAGTWRTGLVRSTDDGVTWDVRGLRGELFYQLAWTPAGTMLAGTYSAIMRSRDQGATWDTVLADLGKARSVAVNSHGVAFAAHGPISRSTDDGRTWHTLDVYQTGIATVRIDCGPDDVLYCGCSEGILRSSDDGDHWTLVHQPNATIAGRFNGFTFADSGVVVIPADSGIARSSNGGASWELVRVPTDTLDYRVLCNGLSHELFAMNDGVFASTDNGRSWIRRSRAFAACPLTGGTMTPRGMLLAGTQFAGMYRSPDGGRSFVQSSAASAQVMTLTAVDSGNVCIGTGYGGIWKTSAAGRPVRIGLPGALVYLMVYDASRGLFAVVSPSGCADSMTHPGLYRTIDGGQSWMTLPMPFGSGNIGTLVIHDGWIFAGADSGLYRSRIDSMGWTAVGDSVAPVRSVVSAGNRIYCLGQAGYRFEYSDDGGDHWTVERLPLLLSSSDLLCAFANGGLCVTRAGDYSTYPLVAVSYDSCSTWQYITPPDLWTGGRITALCTASTNQVFAGSTGDYPRVFVSMNGGVEWTTPPSPQTTLSQAGSITAFAVDSAGYVWVGTDAGLCRSTATVTSVGEYAGAMAGNSMITISPNPCHDLATVTFDFAAGLHAELDLCNALGQFVQRISRELPPSGHAMRTVNISSLPRGVYFIRLTVGGRSSARPVVVE